MQKILKFNTDFEKHLKVLVAMETLELKRQEAVLSNITEVMTPVL